MHERRICPSPLRNAQLSHSLAQCAMHIVSLDVEICKYQEDLITFKKHISRNTQIPILSNSISHGGGNPTPSCTCSPLVVPAHPKLYLRTLLTDLVVLMRCLQLAQGQCLQGVGISLSSELKTEDIIKHPKEFLFV